MLSHISEVAKNYGKSEAADARYDAEISASIKDVSDNLKKMTESQRGKYLESIQGTPYRLMFDDAGEVAMKQVSGYNADAMSVSLKQVSGNLKHAPAQGEISESAMKVKDALEDIIGDRAHVVISDSMDVSEDGTKGTRAFLDPETGVFYVNNKFKFDEKFTELATAIHELYHAAEGTKQSEELHRALGEFVQAFPEVSDELTGGVGETIANDIIEYFNPKLNKAQQGYVNATEIDADILGKLLGSEEYVAKLAARNENLVKKLYTYLKAAGKSTQSKQVRRALDKLTKKFGNALDHAKGGVLVSQIGDEEEKENTVTSINEENMQVTVNERASYAGPKAKTANLGLLSKAQKMLDNGNDSETVRKETGWFKGYDGKWRFEIDDSDMTISIPSTKYPKVADIVDHPVLFEAYPELKEIYVTIHDIESGRGSYSRVFGDIEISRDLLNSPEELRSVLIHELQHAIQDKEGFARGASVEYWEKKLVDGYDSRQAYIKAEEKALLERVKSMRLEDANNDTSFVSDMEELEKQRPDHPRGKIDWDTLEQIEEDSPQWKSFDKERDRLSQIYGEEKVFNYLNVSSRLEQIKHKGERFAADLYLDTAGEIEARDVQKRLRLDETQRKNTRPDIDQGDVVFASDSLVSRDFVGWTADGTEVYKTDPAIMQMSKRDRIEKFRNDFLNQFKGRTAKFVRNGHTYYARFVESKHGLGKFAFEGNNPKSKSDDAGYRAKVRLIAQGDIFNIVEESRYRKSEKETGKTTLEHKNAQYWDYFWKEVFVDGKGYDVIINIRNDSKTGSLADKTQFIYSMSFTENKKVATPITTPASSKLVGVNLGVSTNNSIPQNSDLSTKKSNINDRSSKTGKDTVEMSRGEIEKLRANYQSEKVFDEKGVSNALNGITMFKKLPPKVRGELIKSIWTGFNEHRAYDRYIEVTTERLYATIMQETDFELYELDVKESKDAEKRR